MSISSKKVRKQNRLHLQLPSEQIKTMPDHVEVPAIPDEMVAVLKKMQQNVEEHGNPLTRLYDDETVSKFEYKTAPPWALRKTEKITLGKNNDAHQLSSYAGYVLLRRIIKYQV